MYENAAVKTLSVDAGFLPDERLWELLIRAGVKVSVVTDEPEKTGKIINSLVNDSAKVVLTDAFPPHADFTVDSAESLGKLRELFGEEE